MRMDTWLRAFFIFPAVSTFWRVFYCTKGIHSGDNQWKAIHGDVASISKT